ncbi:acyltransferase family protein, partial [Thalassospira sp. MCCC 1A01428]|uniref:acyltransferase family protein n=1 Tax=Thalassospira sp. MCCC 1A01428 TaxID=1470575 RepID=UPI000A1E2648
VRLGTLAVVPVILFHAGFQLFGGGFVGVDVFFVISGYLITTILIEEIEGSRFSIVGFYERRARRVLPALFLVMLCSIPFAWEWMLPNQMKDFSQSLVAVSLFASNILFWRESGYFAGGSEDKPMLHTWSLAVEEQYYIVFPIFLFFAWRFRQNRVFWAIVVFSVVSLTLSEWGWRNKPTANFYLAPTRAWEILAGSISAFIIRSEGVKNNNFLSIAGLGCIFFSIFYYDESTPFPSVFALVPVLGSVLIILFSGRRSLVAKLLGQKLFVGIGLVSYSAYLWHQPLFAFARIRTLYQPSDMLMLFLCGLSFILAFFSWKFVEQPFRKGGKKLIGRGFVFSTSALGLVFFASLGFWGHIDGGIPSRLSDDVLKIASASKDAASSVCYYDANKKPKFPDNDCLHTVSFDGPLIMLLGDSHSWAISEELTGQLSSRGFNVYNASYGGCPPLNGLRRFDPNVGGGCHDFVRDALHYARSSGVDTIVLTGRFPLYLNGNRYDNGEGGVESGFPVTVDQDEITKRNLDKVKRKKRVLSIYEASVLDLSKSFNVVLVAPIPEAGWNVPDILAKQILFYNEKIDELSTSFSRYKSRAGEVLSVFEKDEKENTNIVLSRVYEALCSVSTGRCLNSKDDDVYYIDDDHLSNAGARLIAPIVVDSVLTFYPFRWQP